MCNRFTLRTPLNLLAERFLFDVENVSENIPRYNVAPTQTLLTVVRDAEHGTRQGRLMRWGLVPSWAKDVKVGFTGFNARGETLQEKPAFKNAYRKRRCLILADGYYEWKTVGKAKKPYLYEVDGGQPFAFAGLWEQWWGPDKSAETPLESCAIVTTRANELASQIHDRMPVILEPGDYEAWLDTAQQDVGYLLEPLPADRMTVRTVSTHVNNSRHEGPQCVGSADDAE
jgi:putative SOS response-associated peptidase YedK